MKKLAHPLLFFFITFFFTACEPESLDDSSSSSGGSASSDVIHNQGQNCITCHGSSVMSNSSGVFFDIGGTVFDQLNTSDNSAGINLSSYTVRLRNPLGNPTIINMVIASNGTGNIYTTQTPSNNEYVAEIILGSTTISSPANHGVGKETCNSCHTSTGTGGSENTKGRIVGEISLSNDVIPLFGACATNCHSVTYSHASTGVQISNPTSSTFLQNASSSGHAGSAAVSTSNLAYRSAYEWVRQGANNN